MAKLEYLILHCSDTPPEREVTKKDLEQWHLIERGWIKLGYSKLFQRTGIVVDLYDIDSDGWISEAEMTNGAVGFNGKSVHWCFAGGKGSFGLYRDILTDNQVTTFKVELNEFIREHKDIKIIGHNQVSEKNCPSFKVSELLKALGINSKHILEGKL